MTVHESHIDNCRVQLSSLCDLKIRATRNDHHCSREEVTVSKPSAIRENIFQTNVASLTAAAQNEQVLV